jgi:hypothetical protein
MANNNNQRGRNNNNAEGRNQYSRGWADSARERPATAAAVAAAAVGAGVFLWSRREQISNQISQLSDQVGQWTESMQNSRGQSQGTSQQFETAGGSSTGFEDSATSSSPSTFGATSQTGL